jgi:hypothetical protein
LVAAQQRFSALQISAESLKHQLDSIVACLSQYLTCAGHADIQDVLLRLITQLQKRKELNKIRRAEIAVLRTKNEWFFAEIQQLRISSLFVHQELDLKNLSAKQEESGDLGYFGVQDLVQLKGKYIEMQTSLVDLTTRVRTAEFEAQSLSELVKLRMIALEAVTQAKTTLEETNLVLTEKLAEAAKASSQLREENAVSGQTCQKLTTENQQLKVTNIQLLQENFSLLKKSQQLSSTQLELAEQVSELDLTTKRLMAENSLLHTQN